MRNRPTWFKTFVFPVTRHLVGGTIDQRARAMGLDSESHYFIKSGRRFFVRLWDSVVLNSSIFLWWPVNKTLGTR